MAQKRKTDHRKKAGNAGGKKTDGKPLAEIEALLKKIEEQAARAVKGNLGDNWRDNLFDLLMARADLAAPHRKRLAALPHALRKEPATLPHFARLFWGTMKRILILAKAPARPHHVAVFGALYLSFIDTFLKDETRDLSKTMAAVDKRLGWFEQVAIC